MWDFLIPHTPPFPFLERRLWITSKYEKKKGSKTVQYENFIKEKYRLNRNVYNKTFLKTGSNLVESTQGNIKYYISLISYTKIYNIDICYYWLRDVVIYLSIDSHW
jgi:hypothetical protein